MKINKYITFGSQDAPKLLLYLKQNNIPYKCAKTCNILEIFDDDPHWPAIKKIVEESTNLFSLSETTFTKEELNKAEWLRVRSQWHNGYPQPEGAFEYLNITYDGEKRCKDCGCGLTQITPFRIKGTPKWGARNFMELNWVNELFVDDTAKAVLTNAELSGFHFSPVCNKSGKEFLPGIHQICIDAVSRPGFVAGRQDIQAIYVCSACGTVRYHPNGIGMHAFHRGALENMPDFCKSNEHFGWGRGADPLILVRQRVYRTIVDNHIDRGVVFEPIELI